MCAKEDDNTYDEKGCLFLRLMILLAFVEFTLVLFGEGSAFVDQIAYLEMRKFIIFYEVRIEFLQMPTLYFVL